MRLNDGPDQVQIDSEVLMHNNIPECDDLCPWYFRMGRPDLGSKRSASFAEQCQTMQDGALHENIVEKNCSPTRGKRLDQFNLIQRIQQPKSIGSHRLTASRFT